MDTWDLYWNFHKRLFFINLNGNIHPILFCPHLAHDHHCGELHFSWRKHLIIMLCKQDRFYNQHSQEIGTYCISEMTQLHSSMVHIHVQLQLLGEGICLLELFESINSSLVTMLQVGVRVHKDLYVDPLNTIAKKVPCDMLDVDGTLFQSNTKYTCAWLFGGIKILISHQ